MALEAGQETENSRERSMIFPGWSLRQRSQERRAHNLGSYFYFFECLFASVSLKTLFFLQRGTFGFLVTFESLKIPIEMHITFRHVKFRTMVVQFVFFVLI